MAKMTGKYYTYFAIAVYAVSILDIASLILVKLTTNSLVTLLNILVGALLFIVSIMAISVLHYLKKNKAEKEQYYLPLLNLTGYVILVIVGGISLGIMTTNNIPPHSMAAYANAWPFILFGVIYNLAQAYLARKVLKKAPWPDSRCMRGKK